MDEIDAGDSQDIEVWTLDIPAGNVVSDGAVGSSSGYYIGWDGDSNIGVHNEDASDLAPFGENVNCGFMGSFSMFSVEDEETEPVRVYAIIAT